MFDLTIFPQCWTLRLFVTIISNLATNTVCTSLFFCSQTYLEKDLRMEVQVKGVGLQGLPLCHPAPMTVVSLCILLPVNVCVCPAALWPTLSIVLIFGTKTHVFALICIF